MKKEIHLKVWVILIHFFIRCHKKPVKVNNVLVANNKCQQRDKPRVKDQEHMKLLDDIKQGWNNHYQAEKEGDDQQQQVGLVWRGRGDGWHIDSLHQLCFCALYLECDASNPSYPQSIKHSK